MIDKYTKATLTVIAMALVVLAIENTNRAAAAFPDEPMEVQLCDTLGSCASLAPIFKVDGGAAVSGYALVIKSE